MRQPSDHPAGWLVTANGFVLNVERLVLHGGVLTVTARGQAPDSGTIRIEAGRQPVALFGDDRALIGVFRTKFDEGYEARDGGTLIVALPLHITGDADDAIHARKLAAAQSVLNAGIAQ